MRGSRYVVCCVLVAVTLIIGGCGGSGGSSTAPTGAVAAPSITTPNTMIYIGQTITFTASGSGTITWGGDSPAVATIDGPTGKVTGVSTGDETIWAQNSAGRTTRLVHALPSFGGTWSGTYAITGCQSQLDWTQFGFCNTIPAGSALPIALSILQTQDQVSGGNFALGQDVGNLNPTTVTSAGELPITGLFAGVNGTVTTNINIGNALWDSKQAGTITGTFDQTWSQTGGLAGSAILNCSINLLTRTGGGPSAISIFQRPESAPLSLDQILRRLR